MRARQILLPLLTGAVVIGLLQAPAAAVVTNTGQRDPQFTPLSLTGQVTAITEVTGGKLLIGGSFTDAGGNAATDYLALLTPNGERDSSFTPLSLNAGVRVVAEVGTASYLVGGDFTDAGGDPATDRIARVLPNGGRDVTFTPVALNDTVRVILPLSGGKLLVGGDFTDVGGDPDADRLVRLNADGTRDASFTPAVLNGPVHTAVADADGGFTVGGAFTDAAGKGTWDRVARLTTTGAAVDTFTPPALNAVVRSAALAADGAGVLLGGDFTDVGGAAGPDRLVRLAATGLLDATFTPPTLDSAVRSVIPVSGTVKGIVVGGDFTNAGGVSGLTRLARLTPAGAIDPTFEPLTLNAGVAAVREVTGGKYVLGGSFTDASGSSATDYLARVGIWAQSKVDVTDLAFGNQQEDTTSAAKVVTVSNPGFTDLLPTGVSLTGRNAAAFLVTADTCTKATLAPGASCQVSVAFAPKAPGDRTARLRVESNATVKRVNLTGTATAAPKPPAVPRLASFTVLSNRTTQVSWEAAAEATGYVVSINGVTRCNVTAGTTKCTAPVAYGRLTAVTVTAYNAVGRSAPRAAAFRSPAIPVRYATVTFRPKSAWLGPKQRARIRNFSALLASRGFSALLIDGHAAKKSDGGVASRKRLAVKRAANFGRIVNAQFTRAGIDLVLIERGLAAKKPAATNATRAGRAANRRATLFLR